MYQRGFPATTDHPPPPIVRRSRGVTLIGAVLLLTVALILGALLYFAQFSGTVRWLLGVSFLTILAALAWDQIARRTSEPTPLVGPGAPAVFREGELGSFAASVRRAASGLPYSQVLVAARARAAFVERARLARGVSYDAMRDAQRNPEALRRLLGDDVLADFVHLETHDLEERYRWVLQARKGAGFGPEFRGVLQRMEAWK